MRIVYMPETEEFVIYPSEGKGIKLSKAEIEELFKILRASPYIEHED